MSLIAAFLLCPCHLPILVAALGTGAVGGLLARNGFVLFVALTSLFSLTLWRYVAEPKFTEQAVGPARNAVPTAPYATLTATSAPGS